jgi:hypothetical protein
MRMLRILAGLLFVPLLAADAPAPPEGWKEFSPKDKSFSVWLPDSGDRTEQERTLTVLRQRSKVNIIKLEADDGTTYAASVLLISPRDLSKIPMKQRIEIVRDAFLNEIKGTIADEKDIKHGRVAGKEYAIETRKGMARLRVFAVGGRVYRASIAGTKEQVQSKDADTFLALFKLPEKAAAAPAKEK